jgi:hypothetical protein
MNRNKFIMKSFKCGLGAAALMPVVKSDFNAIPLSDDPDCEKKWSLLRVG